MCTKMLEQAFTMLQIVDLLIFVAFLMNKITFEQLLKHKGNKTPPKQLLEGKVNKDAWWNYTKYNMLYFIGMNFRR